MKKIQITATVFAFIALIALAVAGAFANLGTGGSKRPEKSEEDYVAEGRFYYDQGSFSEALASFKGALELNENNLEALRGEAKTCVNLSYYDEAEKAYYTISEQKDATTDDKIELIEFLVRNNKHEDARNLIEKYMASDNDERYQEIYDQMTVNVPELSLKSGTYDQYQLLTVTNVPENSIVYYTTDGSEPTVNSPAVGEGVVISYPKNKIKVKAIGYLGYESETVELNVNISKKVEEVKLSEGDSWNESPLEYCLRRQLNKNYNDKYYNYETAQITSLYLFGRYEGSTQPYGDAQFYADSYFAGYSKHLKDDFGNNEIRGLKYFPYLRTLCVGYQEKFDVSQLKNLKNLKELSILHSNVSDISALKNLTSLESLTLGWNNITDISPVASLTNLRTLGLWNNKIKDISKLSGLTELTYLDIAENKVSDISAIKNMPKLSEVWVNGNNIADMSPFTGMTGIRTLMQTDNPGANAPIFETMKSKLVKTDIK